MYTKSQSEFLSFSQLLFKFSTPFSGMNWQHFLLLLPWWTILVVGGNLKSTRHSTGEKPKAKSYISIGRAKQESVT